MMLKNGNVEILMMKNGNVNIKKIKKKEKKRENFGCNLVGENSFSFFAVVRNNELPKSAMMLIYGVDTSWIRQ